MRRRERERERERGKDGRELEVWEKKRGGRRGINGEDEEHPTHLNHNHNKT